MTSKWSAWSEGQAKPSSDDITHGLGDDGAVSTLVVRRGVVVLCDCVNCGRQYKGVEPWGHIVLFHLRQVPRDRAGNPVQPAPWVYTRQGVMSAVLCNSCGKVSELLIDWDEVRRYVDLGVRNGFIDPRVLRTQPRR